MNFLIRRADFGSDQRLQFYKELADDISKNDVGLLINNVGVMHVNAFLETSPDFVLQTLEVNTFPGVLLTQFLLPKLRARKSRSGIINVSSLIA